MMLKVPASQTLIFLSPDDETTASPLGENATHVMSRLCAWVFLMRSSRVAAQDVGLIQSAST